MSDRLRKSTKKQVISIILVLTLLLSVILSGCHGQSSEIQNKKFRKFTELLVDSRSAFSFFVDESIIDIKRFI